MRDKGKAKLDGSGSRRGKGSISVTEKPDQWDPVLKQMSPGQREAREAGWWVRRGEECESTDSQEYQQHSEHKISSEREMETSFRVGKKAIIENPLGDKGRDHSN